jgi:hypothetical protein
MICRAIKGFNGLIAVFDFGLAGFWKNAQNGKAF